ncbi:MAG: ABC transporter substrate-binding protein [Desulfobacula sp.]|jgi:peptide/nickel transport system substrate-binding protein|nr:ABC transporter substrate-binding protein [Desulfobacula sp.]MBT3484320.1 ABC transporter substrate-binding protein [Desulfobacula sp.]MBT3806169.1 ABC transporter substrate-binding protein [Desulfobacula sp.]MBT4024129.1 ABC transporter substrate-binding protein [Desulfobacula sp.]MBT4197453.1 ABC transporter substrate-binding protein [Desulfobacula sp.]
MALKGGKMKNKLKEQAGTCLKFFLLTGIFIAAAIVFFSCQKSREQVFLKIGLPEEPRSMNIWLGTDANSRKILSLIYQPLFRRDPETLQMLPWLARENPIFDKKALTYTVKLRQAKWSDGSDFTSQDVLFTRRLFLDFKIPRYYSSWKIIKKIEAPDAHTIVFHLNGPSAIFMSRIMTAPIVSKKEWGKVAKEALRKKDSLRALQDHSVKMPIGTGPFAMVEYKKGTYIHMQKNPYFFGKGMKIGNHLLGPNVDDLLFSLYSTSEVAISALKNGNIDFYWWDIQPDYIKILKEQDNIDLYFNKKSALYYLGFNLRKPPFNDKVLRQVVATVINKEFILTRILQNFGTSMHSIVPSGNNLWYNPDVKKYGYGKDQDQRIKLSHEMLKKAGYSWEIPPVTEEGKIVKPSDIRLPSGKKMDKFIILTPLADYDPKRAFTGIMIQEWLRELGLPAFAESMDFNSLLDTVKGEREFDAFVMGYGKLGLDTDYLRSFFYSKNDVPQGLNMSGYNNPEFDRLADIQRTLIDTEKRKKIIWQMQKILSEDIPYLPLYNPHIIEAVFNKRFKGWLSKVDGIGNMWSLCVVKPK